MMNTNRETEPVVVFTGHSWEAELLLNIFKNEGIKAYINNEVVGTLFPFYTTPGMSAVKVVVSRPDETKAKLLVEDFEKNRL